jgi:hypothetical protein
MISAASIYFLENKAKVQIEEILKETFGPSVDSVDVNLSFFHRFPHPYLCVQNLKVNNHSDNEIRSILYIQEMDSEINFIKLLKGEYEIKSLNIRDGVLTFFTDSLGKSIRLLQYKERDTLQKKGPLLLTLPNLHFQNVTISGQNDFKKSNWEIDIQNADFHGVVENGIIDLEGKIIGLLDSFSIQDNRILENKPIELVSKIEINQLERVTILRDGVFNFGGIPFNTEGSVKSQHPHGNILDLSFHAMDEFEGLLGLLPSYLKSQFEQVNESARNEIDIQINGLSGAKKNADLCAKMTVSDAAVYSSEYDVKLDSLDFELEFLNIERTNELILKNLEGKLKGKPIFLEMHLTDFRDPLINLDFDINLDLNDLGAFIPLPKIEKLGGLLALNGQVRGKLNEQSELFTSFNGQLDFENNQLSISRSNLDFKSLNGQIQIRDSLLFINELSGDLSGIPFKLTGAIDNSYRLFKNNLKDLEFDLKLYSNSVNLNKVFTELSNTSQKVNKAKHPLNLPYYLAGEIQINTPQLTYRAAVAEDFSAAIILKNGDINIPNLSTDVLHGHLSLNAKLKKNSQKYYNLITIIDLGNINAKRLLEIFNNFDQKVLTSQQVEGRVSANVQLKALIDANLTLPSDGISYVGEYNLKKAELIDFEPIVKALRHVKKKEAAHIYIDNLSGKALFHRHQLIIPSLNFQSNLTSMSLFGNRKPNEEMDFNVELSLKELLFSPKKRKKKRKKTIERGGMEVRLNLTGKPGEMKVKTRNKRNFEDIKKATKRSYSNIRKQIF